MPSNRYLGRHEDAAPSAPRVPWNTFLRHYFDWEVGEHVTIIGPTGQGKTVLLMNLIALRTFSVVFATKPRDPSMDNLMVTEGFEKYDAWPRGLKAEKHPRRLIWPTAETANAMIEAQKIAFDNAFDNIYVEGGWNLFIDEGWWFARKLGMGDWIQTFLLQARSLEISLITATQRPSAVPVELYDMSTHLFFYRDNDRANLDRLSGVAYADSDVIRVLVSKLEQYQFLYVNTRTGVMLRSHAPKPKGGTV
jgi:hypothetical protein